MERMERNWNVLTSPDGKLLFQNRNGYTDHERISPNVSVAMQLPKKGPKAQDPLGFYEYVRPALRDAGFQYPGEILEELKKLALKGQESRRFAIQTMSLLFDMIYDTGYKKRSSLLQLYHEALNEIFSAVTLSN